MVGDGRAHTGRCPYREAHGDVNESDPREDHRAIVRKTNATIGLPMMFFRVHVVVT
jgi:hypothetical protein